MSARNVETAPDQVARLLALVPYLLSRGEIQLDQAAQHFDISPAQLDKDLRLLFMTGLSPGLPGDLIEVDIDALEGEGMIRVSNADYLARPVRFAPAEATALIVALRTLLEAAPSDVRAPVARTLDKLEAAAGADAAAMPLHVQQSPSPGAEHLPTIEAAIANGHQLTIDYHVPSRDENRPRVVDPRSVATVDNVLYLDAWCHRANAERVFRIDRIIAATEMSSLVVDPRSRPRDLSGGWFSEENLETATLRLAPEAFWVAEYYPVRDRRDAADGRVDVDLPVTSEMWLTRLLLRLTPHVEVIEPRVFRETYATALARTLSQYE